MADVSRDNLIKNRFIQGAGFLLISHVTCKFISLIGHIVLARVLFPGDFGVYAVAAFIVTFFMSLFANGLPAALLQKKEKLNSREVSDFFTLQQVVAFSLYGIIWISAPAISAFYGIPSITANYVRVFSLVIVFASIKAFPCVLMERELNYKYLGIVDVAEGFAFQGSTVLLALLGYGAWSFAWGMLISRVISLIVAWALAGQIPRLGFHWVFLKNTFLFGIFMQLGNIFNLLRDALVPIYIGKELGMSAAGYINWAWLLATHPMFIALIFERTSYATLSKIQDQPEKFGRAVENLFFVNNIVVPLIATMIASQATWIVHFIFTDRWQPAIPLIYLISCYALIFPSGNIATNAINALGKSRVTFMISAWFFVYYCVATYFFTKWWGMVGYGAVVATGSFNYLILYAYLKSRVKVRLARASLQPIFASLVAGGFGYYLSHYLLSVGFFNFVFATAVTGAIYTGIIFLFFRKDLRPIVSEVIAQIRSRTLKHVLIDEIAADSLPQLQLNSEGPGLPRDRV